MLNQNTVVLKDQDTQVNLTALAKATLTVGSDTYELGYVNTNTFTQYVMENSAIAPGQGIGFSVNVKNGKLVKSSAHEASVTIKFEVALLEAGVTVAADKSVAHETYYTATLNDVTIASTYADASNGFQNITLGWKSGSLSQAEVTKGQIGNDKSFDLYPAYNSVAVY